MNKTLACAAALSFVLVSEAGAFNHLLNSVWGSKGNDTGGIIPWSPENEANAFEIAQRNCGWYNKFAVPTSIYRRPGEYIAYKCVWDEPAVAVRHRPHRRVDVTISK